MNAQGERFFVKFHWIPELGVHSLMWDEALKIGGQDPGMFTPHVAGVHVLNDHSARLPS